MILQIRNPNGGSAVELSHNHLQRILAETSQPTSMVSSHGHGNGANGANGDSGGDVGNGNGTYMVIIR